jgi:hypothetical protein
MTWSSMVKDYRHFERNHCLHLQSRSVSSKQQVWKTQYVSPELRWNLSDCTASYLRRQRLLHCVICHERAYALSEAAISISQCCDEQMISAIEVLLPHRVCSGSRSRYEYQAMLWWANDQCDRSSVAVLCPRWIQKPLSVSVNVVMNKWSVR